jgi:hypothetical protein
VPGIAVIRVVVGWHYCRAGVAATQVYRQSSLMRLLTGVADRTLQRGVRTGQADRESLRFAMRPWRLRRAGTARDVDENGWAARGWRDSPC